MEISYKHSEFSQDPILELCSDTHQTGTYNTHTHTHTHTHIERERERERERKRENKKP